MTNELVNFLEEKFGPSDVQINDRGKKQELVDYSQTTVRIDPKKETIYISWPKEELVEALADGAHTAWGGWMEYLFSKGTFLENGDFVIPVNLVGRWMRQSTTAYCNLPEEEKESDRKEAIKILDIFMSVLNDDKRQEEEEAETTRIAWEVAKNHLDVLLDHYIDQIGKPEVCVGRAIMALEDLLRRYNRGDRNQELYDAIMQAK